MAGDRTEGYNRNRRGHGRGHLGEQELARYMTLDNYRNNWLRIGFTEADLANGGSDAFINSMVLWGSAGEGQGGPASHFAAGATHVAIQPVHPEGDRAAGTRSWRRSRIPDQGLVTADWSWPSRIRLWATLAGPGQTLLVSSNVLPLPRRLPARGR